MLKLILKTGVYVLLLGFVGCATTQRPFDYDHDVDFSGFKTFNWHPEAHGEKAYEVIKNSFVEKRFKRIIEEELGYKGFTIEPEKPDLFVSYHVTVREKEYTSVRFPELFFHGSFHHGHNHGHHGHSYHCGFPYYPERYSYDESTIVIDIFNPASNELIWRGWTVDRAYGPTISESMIAKTVQKILENFPPY